MPKLTADNLINLAAQARQHLYGCSETPVDKQSFVNRPTLKSHSCSAWVFGPEDSYLCKSNYKTLVGIGVGDGLVCGPRRDGREGLSTRPEDSRLKTIEETLTSLLVQYPPDRGFDVVVAMSIRHTSTASAAWEHAGEVDTDCAECLKRCGATPCNYDMAAMQAEDQVENSHRAAAAVNSGELPIPAECLECGGTTGVLPGGMGCARCH